MTLRYSTMFVFTLALLLGSLSTVRAQETATLSATLSGKNVIPSAGDPDGAGTASVTIDPAKRQVCYEVNVREIDPSTMAHIHRGAVGASGPPVVSLTAPKDGTAKGCVGELDAAVLNAIIANPANFYVNVHTSSYRAGAVRGQLGK
ncbi:MAG TPA: CHRD domain-containing protein [Gemmatimonadaceae bacterium]|nr:CHRD domain-containing protein [Gemmatimonadaceae bacterium]